MDTGFDLERDGDDRADGLDNPIRRAQRTADDASRTAITVTLCACLLIATIGIVGLMATGHNVNKEVSIAVAAGFYKLCERLK